MKYLFIILIILSITIHLNAQNVNSNYSIGSWQGFKQGAISLTFDDGCPNQLAIAIPMMNEYNFKATLFTITGWGANWPLLKAAAAMGHEIGSHSVTHASLDALTDDQQKIETLSSQDTINAHIPGNQCITIAYPYCAIGKVSNYESHYIAARGCSGIVEQTTPYNFMYINSIICGLNGSVNTITDFSINANYAASTKGWAVFLIHGIQNDGGFSTLDSATLRGALSYFNINKDKFWVSTFSNVARYIKERNAASVIETSNTDNKIIVAITDTLSNDLYNLPITLRRILPATWDSLTITQNGKPILFNRISINAITYIQFDAIPNAGDVQLTKLIINDIKSIETKKISFTRCLNLSQDHNEIILSLPNSISSSFDLNIYDLQGLNVASFKTLNGLDGKASIRIPDNLAKNSLYILKLNDENNSCTIKLKID